MVEEGSEECRKVGECRGWGVQREGSAEGGGMQRVRGSTEGGGCRGWGHAEGEGEYRGWGVQGMREWKRGGGVRATDKGVQRVEEQVVI